MHTHTGAPKGGDGQNERPGGKLHQARDTTRGRTFPKTRCPSSVGGCTDREGISHFQYGHGGYILHPCTTHTTHMRRRFLVLAQVGWGRGRGQNCTPNTRPTHERLYTINYCTINTQHCTQMEWRRIGQAAVGGGGTH